jgi:hypothetical protein
MTESLRGEALWEEQGLHLASRRECPDSEVRIILRRARLRTSESKDTSNLLI